MFTYEEVSQKLNSKWNCGVVKMILYHYKNVKKPCSYNENILKIPIGIYQM